MTPDTEAYIKALTEWYVNEIKRVTGAGGVTSNASTNPGNGPPPPPPGDG